MYLSAQAYADDVRLIWANARVYNEPGSTLYDATHSLSETFEKNLDQLIDAVRH